MTKSSTGKYLCFMLNTQHEYLIFARVIAVFNCLLEIHFSVGNSNLSSHCGISSKNGCHKNFIYSSGSKMSGLAKHVFGFCIPPR